MRVGEEWVVPSVVEEVCRVLGRGEVLEVTQEHLEIMLTPPTSLWHRRMQQE